jgi:hypothetical protein
VLVTIGEAGRDHFSWLNADLVKHTAEALAHFIDARFAYGLFLELYKS